MNKNKHERNALWGQEEMNNYEQAVRAGYVKLSFFPMIL